MCPLAGCLGRPVPAGPVTLSCRGPRLGQRIRLAHGRGGGRSMQARQGRQACLDGHVAPPWPAQGEDLVGRPYAGPRHTPAQAGRWRGGEVWRPTSRLRDAPLDRDVGDVTGRGRARARSQRAERAGGVRATAARCGRGPAARDAVRGADARWWEPRATGGGREKGEGGGVRESLYSQARGAPVRGAGRTVPVRGVPPSACAHLRDDVIASSR